MNKDFYAFLADNLQGKAVSMNVYRGKAVLVVNTASKCGLTPQYKGLESLYREYRDNGLVILGFPCNQFGRQEPGEEKSVSEGCLINYGVSFPMFSKIDVNGKNAHPLYIYLKNELGGVMGGAVKWNFTKFLIDRQGNPVKRFAPVTTPKKITEWIKAHHILDGLPDHE